MSVKNKKKERINVRKRDRRKVTDKREGRKEGWKGGGDRKKMCARGGVNKIKKKRGEGGGGGVERRGWGQ